MDVGPNVIGNEDSQLEELNYGDSASEVDMETDARVREYN